MNTDPIVIDYQAIITPGGMIALVVRSPRLIPSASTYVLGAPWHKLLGEGWTSKPCDVKLRDELFEVKDETPAS